MLTSRTRSSRNTTIPKPHSTPTATAAAPPPRRAASKNTPRTRVPLRTTGESGLDPYQPCPPPIADKVYHRLHAIPGRSPRKLGKITNSYLYAVDPKLHPAGRKPVAFCARGLPARIRAPVPHRNQAQSQRGSPRSSVSEPPRSSRCSSTACPLVWC